MAAFAAPTTRNIVVTGDTSFPTGVLVSTSQKQEEASFSPPAYYTSFLQNVHGGNQDLFNKSSLKTVDKAVSLLCNAFQSGKDMEAFFPTFLNFLAKERRQLAYDFKNSDAPFFGMWMTDPNAPEVQLTFLTHQYKPYGDMLIASLQSRLRTIIQEQGTKSNVPGKPLSKAWGNEESRVYVRVINKEEITAISKGTLDPMKLFTLSDGAKIGATDLLTALHYMQKEYPSKPDTDINRKSSLVLQQVAFKVDGTWHALSAHLTWLLEDTHFIVDEKVISRAGEDCSRLSPGFRYIEGKKSEVLVISPGESKLSVMMPVTGRLFSRIVHWDGRNEQEMLDCLADLHYHLNEIPPFFRGTAAIAENAAKTLLKFHGCPLVPFEPKTRVDLETHRTPYLPTFRKNYPTFYAQHPTQERNVQLAHGKYKV